MIGCLKNLLKACILVLAVIGFGSIGGKEYVTNWYNNFMNPPQDVMMERAQKVGDFSKIGDEYEIDKATSALGYNGVLAEHNVTGQKLIVVDTGKKPLLTPQDFKDGSVDKKIENLTKKLKTQFISVDEVEITRRGTMTSFGKKVNYVRFEAKVKKLPIDEITGIVSAVETEDGDLRLLISANEKGKYSQLVSNDFFKKVK